METEKQRAGNVGAVALPRDEGSLDLGRVQLGDERSTDITML